MSKVTDSIRCVLQKAVSYAEGKVTKTAYHVHVPKAIGTNLDMTQEKSTGQFGFSINTPRHWEQGSRHREGERGARARLSHSTFCFSDFWRAVDSCSSAYHFGSQRQPNAFQVGAARRRRQIEVSSNGTSNPAKIPHGCSCSMLVAIRHRPRSHILIGAAAHPAIDANHPICLYPQPGSVC